MKFSFFPPHLMRNQALCSLSSLSVAFLSQNLLRESQSHFAALEERRMGLVLRERMRRGEFGD
jgi:hypothetical protein